MQGKCLISPYYLSSPIFYFLLMIFLGKLIHIQRSCKVKSNNSYTNIRIKKLIKALLFTTVLTSAQTKFSHQQPFSVPEPTQEITLDLVTMLPQFSLNCDVFSEFFFWYHSLNVHLVQCPFILLLDSFIFGDDQLGEELLQNQVPYHQLPLRNYRILDVGFSPFKGLTSLF